MSGFTKQGSAIAAAATLLILAGCGGGAGNSANGSVAAPAANLGPLTAEQICSQLDPGTVSGAIGHPISNAKAGGAGTPQCAYRHQVGTSSYDVTVAYQRPDGDLAGKQGEEGFNHAVELNRGMAGSGAQQTEVDAGQKAVRLTGTTIHLGILLAGGRVLTVAAYKAGVSDQQMDRLMGEVAAKLGK